jgi:cell division transport system permease protein
MTTGLTTARGGWRTAIAVGVCILIPMSQRRLSVAFATRGAMATNKAVIEVLHLSVRNGLIARHFQHHFLRSAGRAALAKAARLSLCSWRRP